MTLPLLKSKTLGDRGNAKRTRLAFGALICLFLLIAVSRLGALDRDPPSWMPRVWLVDGGWWNNGARGKVLFGDYFSEDFGMAYLITPAYTWALEGIYRLWGVGNVQARLLAGVCNILTIAVIAGLVWRLAGIKECIIVTVLLGVSPFYWGHGRVELPESMQALFVVCAFSLWFVTSRSRIAALGAGMSIATAIAVKPNALMLGFVPVTAAVIMAHHLDRARARSHNDPYDSRGFWLRLGFVCMGFLIIAAVVLWILVVPNWTAFWTQVYSESLIYQFDLRRKFMFPSFAFITGDLTSNGFGTPVFWKVALWSPTIIVFAWLYLLELMIKLRRGLTHIVQSSGMLETAAFGWAIAGSLVMFTSQYQADHRFPILIPVYAILAALFLARCKTSCNSPTAQLSGHGSTSRLFSFCLWAILLFPMMLMLKPLLTREIMRLGANIPLGSVLGVGAGSAGLLFTAIWMLVIIVIAFLHKTGEKIAIFFISHAHKIALPLLLLFECSTIGYYFVQAEPLLADRQNDIANYVENGETVGGFFSASLFHPLPLHTVRRVRAEEPKCSFNELSQQLLPSYYVLPTRYHYVSNAHAEPSLRELIERGYEEVFRFEFGALCSDVSQYEFALFRFISPGTEQKQ